MQRLMLIVSIVSSAPKRTNTFFHDVHPTSLNPLSALQNLTYLDWMHVDQSAVSGWLFNRLRLHPRMANGLWAARRSVHGTGCGCTG